MLFDDEPPPFPPELSPTEKQNWTIDEALARTLTWNDGVRADERQHDNSETSQLLKLPQEILGMVCGYVHADHVLKVRPSSDGRAQLVGVSVRGPFALSSTCRQLRKTAKVYPYTKSTLQIPTYGFLTMINTRDAAIRHDPNMFLTFLMSIPAPRIERIQVIGVHGGPREGNQIEVQGYSDGPENRAELENLIHIIFPVAKISFRAVVHDVTF